jgi:hypothetical protein
MGCSIVGFSIDTASREHFGPFAPGFKIIPFGDAKALEEAITPNTVAFLAEPIQGEAGVILPPPGYFTKARGSAPRMTLPGATSIRVGRLPRVSRCWAINAGSASLDVSQYGFQSADIAVDVGDYCETRKRSGYRYGCTQDPWYNRIENAV